jgi:transcriptional regulator of acetoin/glycerol metabolism
MMHVSGSTRAIHGARLSAACGVRVCNPANAVESRRSLDDPPREAVEEALRKAGGVISRAARTLGLSRQALYRRMQRYGIPE